MVDKDAKVREMRRENLLLTSKIQLLEDQMENLNDRVDRTLRERNQLRREINSVRFDSNVSIEVRHSPLLSTHRSVFLYRQVLVPHHRLLPHVDQQLFGLNLQFNMLNPLDLIMVIIQQHRLHKFSSSENSSRQIFFLFFVILFDCE